MGERKRSEKYANDLSAADLSRVIGPSMLALDA